MFIRAVGKGRAFRSFEAALVKKRPRGNRSRAEGSAMNTFLIVLDYTGAEVTTIGIVTCNDADDR